MQIKVSFLFTRVSLETRQTCRTKGMACTSYPAKLSENWKIARTRRESRRGLKKCSRKSHRWRWPLKRYKPNHLLCRTFHFQKNGRSISSSFHVACTLKRGKLNKNLIYILIFQKIKYLKFYNIIFSILS